MGLFLSGYAESIVAEQYYKLPYNQLNRLAKVIVIASVSNIANIGLSERTPEEYQIINIDILSIIRGRDVPLKLQFRNKPQTGLSYNVGDEAIFFFGEIYKDTAILVDERAAAIFNRGILADPAEK